MSSEPRAGLGIISFLIIQQLSKYEEKMLREA